MQRTSLALITVLALAGGCGQSPSPRISVRLNAIEAGVDASDGASVPIPNSMARCCALAVASADAGDASASGAPDNCLVLARHTLGVVEPCLGADSGAGFGSWTCGTNSPQLRCLDNGLSCNLGDPCTLLDIGCPGVVQACTFTP